MSQAPPKTPDGVDELPAQEMGTAVAKGAVWTTLANVGRIASAVLIIPILSRFLDLEDFGIMQIAMPIVLFLMIFNDVGLGPALIRAKNPSKAMWSSVFWTNLGLGIIVTVGLLLLAKPLADFFHEPEVEPIIQALCIPLILSSIGIVPGSYLIREFKFKEIAIIEVVSIWFGIVAAIVSAIEGAGAWALVYQQVTMYVIKTAMIWWYGRKATVRFEYKWQEIANVFDYSSNLLGTRFVTFVAQNIPNMIIGRLIGAAALGAYSIAFRIMIIPVQIFAHGLTSVLLPAMSQFHEDKPRMKSACLRTYRVIALITFPAMAGIAALAEPIVLFALGEKMAEAGVVLAFLAPIGAISALLSSQGGMFMALGRADVLLRWCVIEAVLMLIGFGIGVQYGLMGCVIGYLIVNLVVCLPSAKAMLRLIDATLIDLGKALWQPLILSVMMSIILRLLWPMDLMFVPTELVWRLIVFVAFGCAFYGAGLALIDRPAFAEFKKIASSITSR